MERTPAGVGQVAVEIGDRERVSEDAMATLEVLFGQFVGLIDPGPSGRARHLVTTERAAVWGVVPSAARSPPPEPCAIREPLS